MNEALVVATMSLIGLQVDAHLRDGSVASGIFLKPSFDHRLGIALKDARVSKKGASVDSSVVSMLEILSGDLLRVVAKGTQLPSEIVTETDISTESTVDRKRVENLRSSVQKDNKYDNGNQNDLKVEHQKRKESKLNPGARIFHPSPTKPVLQLNSTVALNPNMHYIPNNSVLPEVARLNPFVTVKVPPYGNLPSGTVGPTTYIPQLIVGHYGSRAQSVRVGNEFGVPVGLGFVHPPPQSVMVGQTGQVVYLNQASHDVVTPLSTQFARPLPIPHQFQFPKHQGTILPQSYCMSALPPMAWVQEEEVYSMPYNVPVLQHQACSTPYNVPILHQQQQTSSMTYNFLISQPQQQSYSMPYNVPISQQPPFLSNRYVQDRGSNGTLNIKFK